MAFILAVRFRRPMPILCGVLVGTLASDAIGVFLGQRVSELLPGIWLRGVLALAFVAIAVWILVKDDWVNSVNVMVQKSSLDLLTQIRMA